jgi:hypothetical protein
MLRICINKLGRTSFIQGHVYLFSFLKDHHSLIVKGYRAILAVFVFEPKLSLGEGLYRSKCLLEIGSIDFFFLYMLLSLVKYHLADANSQINLFI